MKSFAEYFYAGMEDARRRKERDDELAYEKNVLRPFGEEQMAQTRKTWENQDQEFAYKKNVLWPQLKKQAEQQDLLFEQSQDQYKKKEESSALDDYISKQAFTIVKHTVPGKSMEAAIDGALLPDGTPAPAEYKAKLSKVVKEYHSDKMKIAKAFDDELKRDTRIMMTIPLDKWRQYSQGLVQKYGADSFQNINMQPSNDEELISTKRALSMLAGNLSQSINAGLNANRLDQKETQEAMKRLTALQGLKQKAMAGQVANAGDIANLRMAGIRDINIGDPLPGASNPDWLKQINDEIAYYESLIGRKSQGANPGMKKYDTLMPAHSSGGKRRQSKYGALINALLAKNKEQYQAANKEQPTVKEPEEKEPEEAKNAAARKRAHAASKRYNAARKKEREKRDFGRLMMKKNKGIKLTVAEQIRYNAYLANYKKQGIAGR